MCLFIIGKYKGSLNGLGIMELIKKLHIEGDCPTASFFAITLIEEIGKAIIIYRDNFNKKDFYDHKLNVKIKY